jgi:beta-1,4-mannosyl-glycoprotein beta-1,4-N-acetylglucosaminyltransferase
MSKVYDCFGFFNELDLLEIRLETLDPYVDYFVISECDSTFSGIDKPFFYERHKEKFDKFADKIIHVKNHNSKECVNLSNTHDGKKYDIYNKIIEIHNDHKPEHGHGQPHWCRDYIHREYIKLGMSDCHDDDIIMFSDLDEIPNPEVLEGIRNLDMSKQYCLLQDNNNYYVNNIASTHWRGNIICKYSHLKDKSLNMMRFLSRQDELNFVFIENAGWHLSYMGPPERIKIKLKCFGHQEFNNSFYLNNVENNMNSNKDVLGRGGYNTFNSNLEKFYFDNLKTVKMDGYFPPDMIELIEEKFPYLIKRQ